MGCIQTPVVCGRFLHIEQLERGDPVRHVARRRRDAKRTGTKFLVHVGQHLVQLVERCHGDCPVRYVVFLIGGLAQLRKIFSVGRLRDRHIVEHAHAVVFVGYRRSEVGRPFALALGVPCVNVDGSKLEVQRRRDAVSQACLDAPQIARAMMMGVDESRRDHVPGRVDSLCPADGIFRERDYSPIMDAHVAHGIEEGFRIHYPPVEDDDVVFLRHQGCDDKTGENSSPDSLH